MTRVRNDLTIYERRAAEWWDARSPVFRSLHAVKQHQLERLRALLAPWPARVAVDLGCGGGLLAVPLAELVERVVGVDLSAGSLAAAHARAAEVGADCSFVRADLCRAPLAAGCADLVVASDVLEHLEHPGDALAEAARLLRPRGLLYVNTVNDTRAARLLVVALAEGVGLVPRGTHDPRLFVAPERLVALARAHGLALRALEGEAPRLARTLATRAVHMRRSGCTDVTYNAVFEKEAA